MPRTPITPPATIVEYLSYDLETGHFHWIKRPPKHGGIPVGARAGSLDPKGYWRIRFGGHIYKASRLAWLFVHGEMPPNGIEVDHHSRNRSDDSIDNLRLATTVQNAQNKSKKNGTSSRFKGVCWDKKRELWQSGIGFNGRRHALGRFENEIDAARAYDIAAQSRFGEFAILNLPEVSP